MQNYLWKKTIKTDKKPYRDCMKILIKYGTPFRITEKTDIKKLGTLDNHSCNIYTMKTTIQYTIQYKRVSISKQIRIQLC